MPHCANCATVCPQLTSRWALSQRHAVCWAGQAAGMTAGRIPPNSLLQLTDQRCCCCVQGKLHADTMAAIREQLHQPEDDSA